MIAGNFKNVWIQPDRFPKRLTMKPKERIAASVFQLLCRLRDEVTAEWKNDIVHSYLHVIDFL